MATYGNRPALYKPTDFGSQQKRLSSTPVSTSEVKKEEEKVTFKIQQRPMLSTSDQKPPIMENKSVKILTETSASEKKGGNLKNGDEKPGGVAQKDIDKITKLKEFMARQQIGENEVSKPAPAVNNIQPNGSRDSGLGIGKSNMSYIKPQIPVTTKVPTTTFVKTFTTAKSLVSQGKIVNGEQNPPGIIPGILPGKPGTATQSKPFKENKDPEVTRDEKPGKGKGPRDVAKDGKNKGGGRAALNRNQKNATKSSPAAARNKSIQNDKTGGKTGKANEGAQHTKQTTKTSTNTTNVGTRPKIITSKAPTTNQRLPNEQHKNHNRPYDRSQKHNVNSYYSQANKIPGFPNNELPPWLPYAMNTMNMNNQSSILGQPQGPRVDFTPKPVPAMQDKNSDQSMMAVVSGPSSGQKKVVTVEATKDKSEQKKSLDFVKSFFDTDPEVQYNRKLNAEKRSSANAPVVSAPVTSVSKEEQPVTRLHMNNQVNSHFSSHGDSHVNSHVNNYGNISHASSRLVNNSLNNNQVNNQSFVHSSAHIPGNHIPGAPGSHIPGTHIPGSMASSYSSVYHHSNMSNMAHNAIHPNPQSGHFQGSSTVSPVHMGANPTQLHPAISSHPSSLHHRQQTYDLYSQVNQINPLLTEPDRFIKYCSVMNTNYPY